MGVSKSRLFVRRLRKLEKAFSVDYVQKIDVVLWCGEKGGLFGHAHYKVSAIGEATEAIPCTVEEEMEIMKNQYEVDNHRFFGRSDVSLADYLLGYCYLGPESLTAERASIIQQLRGEASGA